SLVNSWTTARRIACFLFSILFQHSHGESAKSGYSDSEMVWTSSRSENREGDLVVQVHAAARRHDPPVAPANQALFLQPAELCLEAQRRRHPVRRPEAKHQGLRRRLARLELLAVCPGRAGRRGVLA